MIIAIFEVESGAQLNRSLALALIIQGVAFLIFFSFEG